MIICSFRRVKVWVCDFFPCVRHDADRNSSYAFASFSTVLRGLFVFQFCLCSDMSSHYCVFSLRLFTHCRDLIFLIFSGFYLWFVEFSSDFLSSPRSSHAIASTLMIRVRTIACTLYHINVNGKRTNDVYSRLITLTITFYVFQINFSASLWPNDKVRSLSHSFCRSLSLSVCACFLCQNSHFFNASYKMNARTFWLRAQALMMLCIFSLLKLVLIFLLFLFRFAGYTDAWLCRSSVVANVISIYLYVWNRRITGRICIWVVTRGENTMRAKKWRKNQQ